MEGGPNASMSSTIIQLLQRGSKPAQPGDETSLFAVKDGGALVLDDIALRRGAALGNEGEQGQYGEEGKTGKPGAAGAVDGESKKGHKGGVGGNGGETRGGAIENSGTLTVSDRDFLGSAAYGDAGGEGGMGGGIVGKGGDNGDGFLEDVVNGGAESGSDSPSPAKAGSAGWKAPGVPQGMAATQAKPAPKPAPRTRREDRQAGPIREHRQEGQGRRSLRLCRAVGRRSRATVRYGSDR